MHTKPKETGGVEKKPSHRYYMESKREAKSAAAAAAVTSGSRKPESPRRAKRAGNGKEASVVVEKGVSNDFDIFFLLNMNFPAQK